MLCEICGPENDCTCGGCRCRWCRAKFGEVTELERIQMERHGLQVLADDVRQRRNFKEPRE